MTQERRTNEQKFKILNILRIPYGNIAFTWYPILLHPSTFVSPYSISNTWHLNLLIVHICTYMCIFTKINIYIHIYKYNLLISFSVAHMYVLRANHMGLNYISWVSSGEYWFYLFQKPLTSCNSSSRGIASRDFLHLDYHVNWWCQLWSLV